MENQKKRKIEVFTAGCSVCEPLVETVKSMACADCDVIVYNLAETKGNEAADKVKAYGIKAIPAVAVNGKLLSCCQNKGVSEAELKNAGIGQPFS
ncbi:thioredoxin family protein [uncultured Dysgonomonas sp.]|uniref:thioredoxin family protein n=1 Tax=uncultured Dysgonomonas sp. TaxID=206096 RepID=UPI00261EC94D|nr:thioredoxin family protein [uncultured Dysgonomonas sp.]